MENYEMEPASEFNEEVEFRAKVYKLLSSGLSHSEIQRIVRKNIDWSLFSRDTLEAMIQESQTPIVVSLPRELLESASNIPVLAKIHQLRKESLSFYMRFFIAICIISCINIVLLLGWMKWIH